METMGGMETVQQLGQAQEKISQNHYADASIPPQAQVQAPVPPPVTVWLCDVCRQAKFTNFDNAVAHEESCTGAKNQNSSLPSSAPPLSILIPDVESTKHKPKKKKSNQEKNSTTPPSSSTSSSPGITSFFKSKKTSLVSSSTPVAPEFKPKTKSNTKTTTLELPLTMETSSNNNVDVKKDVQNLLGNAHDDVHNAVIDLVNFLLCKRVRYEDIQILNFPTGKVKAINLLHYPVPEGSGSLPLAMNTKNVCVKSTTESPAAYLDSVEAGLGGRFLEEHKKHTVTIDMKVIKMSPTENGERIDPNSKFASIIGGKEAVAEYHVLFLNVLDAIANNSASSSPLHIFTFGGVPHSTITTLLKKSPVGLQNRFIIENNFEMHPESLNATRGFQRMNTNTTTPDKLRKRSITASTRSESFVRSDEGLNKRLEVLGICPATAVTLYADVFAGSSKIFALLSKFKSEQSAENYKKTWGTFGADMSEERGFEFEGFSDLGILGHGIDALIWDTLSTEAIVAAIALKKIENGQAGGQASAKSWSSLAQSVNKKHGTAFKGLGDLSNVGLSITQDDKWNELSSDDIKMRVKGGKAGLKVNDSIWGDSPENIKEKIFLRSLEKQNQKVTTNKKGTSTETILQRAEEYYDKNKHKSYKCGGCADHIKTTNSSKNFRNHIRKKNFICFSAATEEENYPAGGFDNVRRATYNQGKRRMCTLEEFTNVCVEALDARREKRNNKRKGTAKEQVTAKKPKK